MRKRLLKLDIIMIFQIKHGVNEGTCQLLVSRNTIGFPVVLVLRDHLLIQLTSVNGKLSNTKYKIVTKSTN